MISEKIKQYLLDDNRDIVKASSEVAVVHPSNSLDHVILVLTADQYTVVPVIDNDSKLLGKISMTKIIQSVIGDTEIEFDKLSEYKVKDIIDESYYRVTEDFILEDVLNMLVKTSFVFVVDKEGIFKGIITRSTLLKGLNKMAHNIEQDYDLIEKYKEVYLS